MTDTAVAPSREDMAMKIEPLLAMSRWPGWPRWMGSIRFRLTLLYSVVLFGLAAVVVGGIYTALASELNDQPVSRTKQWIGYLPTPRGVQIGVFETETVDVLAAFERAVNTRALEHLRSYTFAALGMLFVTSLVVGWFVSGRVLRPIGRIASVARNIQATDLSRRICMDGPDDELKWLADTFDGMLGRIDDAFESQRQFIHEASHELRNPLAVIRTNVDVTLNDPDTAPEDLRRTAEVVSSSAARMSTLVDDLVVYARHGTRTERDEPVDVRRLVEELVPEFSIPAESRRLQVIVSSNDDDGRPFSVRGDGPALRRAVANLLANAVRLGPEGSKVEVTVEESDGWVRISVADEGPGIPPEDQPLVFQRFWQGRADSSAPESQPSSDASSLGRADSYRQEGSRSGLGLAIVRQIAESHGGSVELASDPGVGSIFVIELPGAQSL